MNEPDIYSVVFYRRSICEILGINYIPKDGKFSEEDINKALNYLDSLKIKYDAKKE